MERNLSKWALESPPESTRVPGTSRERPPSLSAPICQYWSPVFIPSSIPGIQSLVLERQKDPSEKPGQINSPSLRSLSLELCSEDTNSATAYVSEEGEDVPLSAKPSSQSSEGFFKHSPLFSEYFYCSFFPLRAFFGGRKQKTEARQVFGLETEGREYAFPVTRIMTKLVCD